MREYWANTNLFSGFRARQQFFYSSITTKTSDSRFPVCLRCLRRPAPQDRDIYLDVHAMLQSPELRALMHTWSIRSAMKDQGHFRLYGTLSIGHAVHPGFQHVQCWPFPDLKFYGANRQDHIIVRPPGSAAEGFTPSPDNVWYCKTLLLFDMEAETDIDTKVYQ